MQGLWFSQEIDYRATVFLSLKQSIQSLFYFILDITETVCVQLTSLSLVLWCGEISPVFSWRTHGTTCELASGILLWLPQLTCSMQRYFFYMLPLTSISNGTLLLYIFENWDWREEFLLCVKRTQFEFHNRCAIMRPALTERVVDTLSNSRGGSLWNPVGFVLILSL